MDRGKCRDEHHAAVSFLNEISPARVRRVLVEVRFVPGSGAAYYVQFEPKARPNEVLTAAPRPSGNPAADLASKRYIDAVLELVGPAVLKPGYGPVRPYGAQPEDRPAARLACGGQVRGAADGRAVLHPADAGRAHAFWYRDESEVIPELLRQPYEAALAARLPADTDVRWHARIASDVIDFAAVTLDDGGYLNGDVEHAADWIVTCFQAWLDVQRASPVTDAELAAAAATAVSPSGTPGSLMTAHQDSPICAVAR